MNKRILTRLLLLAVLMWIVPWRGKSLLPSILGHAYVQWPCMALNAVILPTGMFLGLLAIRRERDSRWILFGISLCFLSILALNLCFLIAGQHVLTKATLNLTDQFTDMSATREYAKTRAILENQLVQIPWILLTYVIGFIFSFAGVLMFELKQPSANDRLEATGSPRGGGPEPHP